MKALIYKDQKFTLHFMRGIAEHSAICITCDRQFNPYIGYYYTIPFSLLANPYMGHKMCTDCARHLETNTDEFMFKHEHGLL